MKKIESIKFLLSIVMHYKFKIAFLFTLSVALGFASVLKALSLGFLIDGLKDKNSFIILAFYYFVLAIILEIIWNTLKISDVILHPNLRQDIMKKFVNKILTYNEEFFQINSSNQILNALKNIVDKVEDYIETIKDLISTVALAIATLIAFNYVNIVFVWLSLVWILLLTVLFIIGGKLGARYAFFQFRAYDKFAALVGDIVNNFVIIRVFNGQRNEQQNVEKITDEIKKYEKKRPLLFIILGFIEMSLYLIFLGLFLYIINTLYIENKISIGEISIILERFQLLYYYLNELANKFADLIEYHESILSGLDILYETNKTNEKQKLLAPLKFEKGEIVIKNIKFKYLNSTKYDLIVDKEIKIKPGSFVGLIGASGCGKSTFFKLLLKLIESTEGEILIDGQNINSIKDEDLMKIIAFIPQNIGLFNRTINENISYGIKIENENEIKKSAEYACIDEEINELKNKYNTIIGTEVNLSGGQKQRIMIARALAKKAKILLFDESTSALDIETEQVILENVKNLTNNCTKFFIAHRLNTVRNADLILLFENNQIVEFGSPEELLRDKNSSYFKLLETLGK